MWNISDARTNARALNERERERDESFFFVVVFVFNQFNAFSNVMVDFDSRLWPYCRPSTAPEVVIVVTDDER